jgi:hypothetical protein
VNADRIVFRLLDQGEPPDPARICGQPLNDVSIVWTHFYSQSEPARGKEISAVVAALDTNLDNGLKEVVAGLNQYFSANPVGKS